MRLLNEFRADQLDYTLVSLERLTNNVENLTNDKSNDFASDKAIDKAIEKYCIYTFNINAIIDKIWKVTEKYSIEYATENKTDDFLVTPNNFRKCILAIALSKEYPFVIENLTKYFSKKENSLFRALRKVLSVENAKNYLFCTQLPIIITSYKSYIIRNKGNQGIRSNLKKVDDSIINEFVDECYISFITNILSKSIGDELASGIDKDYYIGTRTSENQNVINKIKNTFSARVKNIADNIKIDFQRKGLIVGKNDEQYTTAATDAEGTFLDDKYSSDNSFYIKDNEANKDYDLVEFIEKWKACCNDEAWSKTSEKKVNRKAKLLKFMVLNSTDLDWIDDETFKNKRASDIYKELYKDKNNPNVAYNLDVGIASNATNSIRNIMNRYDISLGELINACKRLGTDKVLGLLKGKGDKLPDSDFKNKATDIIKKRYGRDLLNERKTAYRYASYNISNFKNDIDEATEDYKRFNISKLEYLDDKHAIINLYPETPYTDIYLTIENDSLHGHYVSIKTLDSSKLYYESYSSEEFIEDLKDCIKNTITWKTTKKF